MQVFKIISSIISFYSLICFFRIILTWIPNYEFSKFSHALSKICDPFLNLFSGIKFLRVGGFDFSPALALCILGAASSFFSMLGNGGSLSIPMIFTMILQICDSIVSSLIWFLILLFFVRLMVLVFRKNSYNSGGFIMNQIDSSIAPIVSKISRTFSFGKKLSYKASLVVSIFALILLSILVNVLFAILTGFFL